MKAMTKVSGVFCRHQALICMLLCVTQKLVLVSKDDRFVVSFSPNHSKVYIDNFIQEDVEVKPEYDWLVNWSAETSDSKENSEADIFV